MKKVCFVVNPIAGLGGPYGLKGSDDLEAIKELLSRGVKLRSPGRAERFLKALRKGDSILFLTAGGLMGERELGERGYTYEVVHEAGEWTTPRDTRETVRKAVEGGAEVVVFVGGDGTARDVVSVAGGVPVLGVPAGVKVFSGVFGSTPEASAEILDSWVEGKAEVVEAEVLDIDEEAYRRDVLRVRLYSVAKTLRKGELLQPSKSVYVGASEEENKKAIARYVVEEKIRPGVLYVLGPGSTVKALAEELGVEKTLLGVDLYANGKLVARDVDEETLLKYCAEYPKIVVVVTPIGKQGFILGRGNQQISPKVLRKVTRKDLLVLATRRKLRETPVLRVDTGDPEIDGKMRGYVRVIVDYREEAVVRVV